MYKDTFPARAKWYNIGLCLKLTSSTLDAIAIDFQTCEDKHRESLKKWLKRGRPIPKMMKLIKALKNKTVHESRLAHQLEVKYPKREKIPEGNLLQHTHFDSSASRALPSSQEMEVSKNIEMLEWEFYDLEDNAIELAEVKQWTAKSFSTLLCRLPPQYKDEHILFVEEKMPRIKNANCVEEIFGYLDLYWSFLSPGLLEHILHKLGDPTAIRQMSEFVVKVKEFRRVTLLKIYWKVVSVDPSSRPVDTQVKQLITVHKPESLSGNSTLEDVEEFRKRFAIMYTIDKVALCVSQISPGSVKIAWSIPPSVADQLLSDIQEHPERLENLHLLSASIGSTTVYSQGLFNYMCTQILCIS